MYRTARQPFGGRNLEPASPGMCPAGFEIPVKGELSGDSLTITLQPPRRDFGEQKVHVTSVILSPLAGGLPARTSFELPFKDAAFILERVADKRQEVDDLSSQGGRQAAGH